MVSVVRKISNISKLISLTLLSIGLDSYSLGETTKNEKVVLLRHAPPPTATDKVRQILSDADRRDELELDRLF